MKKAFFCFILLINILSCQSNQATDTHNLLDPELALAFSSLKDTMGDAKRSLAFDNGKHANNCDSYLQLIKASQVSETVNNQITKGEYLICDEISALIQFALFPSAINKDLIGKDLINGLDLRSFPNSLYQSTSDEKFTLAHLYPNNVKAEQNSATFESDDWVMTFKVLAILDANNNNQPDWLLQIADESKMGNYRSYATLIAYDVKSGSTFKAAPFH